MSVDRCRKLLTANCDLSDVEIEKLRDGMYVLAGVAVEGCLASSDRQQQMASSGESDEIALERAAILEFDSGFKRREAERLAGLRLSQKKEGNKR